MCCGTGSPSNSLQRRQMREAAKAGVVRQAAPPPKHLVPESNPHDPRGSYHPAFGFIRTQQGVTR